MYLLHVLGCLMRWHQLVRRLVSSVTQANFNCGASAKVTVLSLTTSCFGLLF